MSCSSSNSSPIRDSSRLCSNTRDSSRSQHDILRSNSSNSINVKVLDPCLPLALVAVPLQGGQSRSLRHPILDSSLSTTRHQPRQLLYSNISLETCSNRHQHPIHPITETHQHQSATIPSIIHAHLLPCQRWQMSHRWPRIRLHIQQLLRPLAMPDKQGALLLDYKHDGGKTKREGCHIIATHH